MKTDNRIIYEPTGPALEYSKLACNIYKGCQHGCLYCFGKQRKSPEQKIDYDTNPNPKDFFLEKLAHKATKMHADTPEILLSFLGDVYQPAEMELMLTRGALEILNRNDLPFTVLTKGGTRATRDFDLLEAGRARFGSTLIFLDQKYASYWEPGAASIADRIDAIQQAHDRGIPTWVSVEPVIEPDQALKVIKELHPIVDHFKVGKINHNREIENLHDWWEFRQEVEGLLQDVEADYYLKKSLTDL
jgi:DNA repair photolyase